MDTPETAITPDPITTEASAVVGQVADVRSAIEHPGVETFTPLVADLSTVASVAPGIVQETRRGWKTSEFWVGIAAAAQAVATELPQTDKVAILALAAVYAVARGIAKQGIPNVVAPPAPQ